MNTYEYIKNIAMQTASQKGFDETLYNAVSFIYRNEYAYASGQGLSPQEATEYANNVLRIILENESKKTRYQYRVELGLEPDPETVFADLPVAK